jgi:hypothetical protein
MVAQEHKILVEQVLVAARSCSKAWGCLFLRLHLTGRGEPNLWHRLTGDTMWAHTNLTFTWRNMEQTLTHVPDISTSMSLLTLSSAC